MESNGQSQTQSSLSTNLTYSDVLDKIMKTYPIYYKIFESYYSTGKDVSYELNRLYQPIFNGLIEYYTQFMCEGVELIINKIKTTYNPEKPYALIDYIEFIYGNIYYETFLHEIKKINSSIISYSHLCVFEYIIRVEIIKYKLYLEAIETIKKTDPESKLLLAMEYRLDNCLKKISFSQGYLELHYPTHHDVIKLCDDMVRDYGINSKIDKNVVNIINSFMEINKKKK